MRTFEPGAPSSDISELVTATRTLLADPDEARARRLIAPARRSIPMACRVFSMTGIWHWEAAEIAVHVP